MSPNSLTSAMLTVTDTMSFISKPAALTVFSIFCNAALVSAVIPPGTSFPFSSVPSWPATSSVFPATTPWLNGKPLTLDGSIARFCARLEDEANSSKPSVADWNPENRALKRVFIIVLLRRMALFQPVGNGGRVRAHVYNSGGQMDKFQPLKMRSILAALLLVALINAAWLVRAQNSSPAPATNEKILVEGFRRVEVASVSDALEQLTGQRMYMSHHMQPIFTSKLAGFARTVRLKKDEGNTDPKALSGMLAAIDEGSENSVYVMAVEDGADIAGMGGLMGTAMAARGYAGAVIDGGVRDVAYLRKIGFPVYATGIVPSTSVHHYRFDASEVPIQCDGVNVNPGDIVAADSDGVVVVPRAKAMEVLRLAQQLDFKEHSMYPVIEKLKSIQEAVKQFGRL